MIGIVALVMIVLLMIAVQAILAGWRGRRIDDHPLCRRCGFDLTGTPRTSDRCSECGADLRHPRAIQVGHRHRRPQLAAAGALVGLFAVASLLTPLFSMNWLSHKPAWLLVRETAYVNADSATWTELTRCAEAGRLDQTSVATLTARVLVRQGDPKQAWHPIWGDFFETARAAKLVNDVQWSTYARQAPQPIFQLREQIRRRDDLTAKVSFDVGRVASNSRLKISMTNPCSEGDLVVPNHVTMGWVEWLTLGSSAQDMHIYLDRRSLSTAPFGPRTLSFSLDLKVSDSAVRPTVYAAWTHTFHGTWTLLAEPTVKLIEDPALGDAVSKSIRVKEVKFNPTDPTSLSFVLDIDSPPVPLAFAVTARSGERNWKLLSVMVDAGVSQHITASIGVSDPLPPKVDLVFRPHIEPVLDTENLTSMWNREVVIKDVIISPPPTTWPD